MSSRSVSLASDAPQFIAAVASTAFVFASIAAIVHYAFADSAVVAIIGFMIPLTLALGVKLGRTK